LHLKVMMPDKPNDSDHNNDDIQLPPPDFSLLPDDDNEALATLSEATDAVRPVRVTPSGERYPPLPMDKVGSSSEEVLDRAGSVPTQGIHATGTKRNIGTSLPADAPLRVPTKHNAKNPYRWVTRLAWLGTFFLCAFYSIVWIEPQSVLNPFPPEIVYVYVTATPQTMAVPDTPLTNNTTTDILDNAPDSPDSLYPFVLSEDGVLYIANSNGRACEWSSIGGAVFGNDGTPLNGYRVRVTDVDDLRETVFTGATLAFGDGGFEFPIGGAPIEATYNVQLFSPQDAPLSDVISVTTRANCDENVAVVTFQEAP
jgi:hypothetical protein